MHLIQRLKPGNKVVTAWLDESLAADLDFVASLACRTRSDEIRQALASHVARQLAARSVDRAPVTTDHR